MVLTHIWLSGGQKSSPRAIGNHRRFVNLKHTYRMYIHTGCRYTGSKLFLCWIQAVVLSHGARPMAFSGLLSLRGVLRSAGSLENLLEIQLFAHGFKYSEWETLVVAPTTLCFRQFSRRFWGRVKWGSHTPHCSEATRFLTNNHRQNKATYIKDSLHLVGLICSSAVEQLFFISEPLDSIPGTAE